MAAMIPMTTAKAKDVSARGSHKFIPYSPEIGDSVGSLKWEMSVRSDCPVRYLCET